MFVVLGRSKDLWNTSFLHLCQANLFFSGNGLYYFSASFKSLWTCVDFCSLSQQRTTKIHLLKWINFIRVGSNICSFSFLGLFFLLLSFWSGSFLEQTASETAKVSGSQVDGASDDQFSIVLASMAGKDPDCSFCSLLSVTLGVWCSLTTDLVRWM